MNSLKANFIYFVISIVLPGGIVQGLRVTLIYICGLAKGTDSDNAGTQDRNIVVNYIIK